MRADLEDMVGPSVSRALAARVLGVSRAALDARISRGDVPVLLTREGRREVPLRALVELANDVECMPPQPGAKSQLGAVLDRQRQDAEHIPIDELLPARYLRDRTGTGTGALSCERSRTTAPLRGG